MDNQKMPSDNPQRERSKSPSESTDDLHKLIKGKFVSHGFNQYLSRVSSPEIPGTSYSGQGDHIQAQQMDEAGWKQQRQQITDGLKQIDSDYLGTLENWCLDRSDRYGDEAKACRILIDHRRTITNENPIIAAKQIIDFLEPRSGIPDPNREDTIKGFLLHIEISIRPSTLKDLRDHAQQARIEQSARSWGRSLGDEGLLGSEDIQYVQNLQKGFQRALEDPNYLIAYNQEPQQPSTRRIDASSSSRDTSNVPATTEPFTDHRELSQAQLSRINDIALRVHRLDRRTQNPELKVPYQKLARCLFRAKGEEVNFRPGGSRTVWLEGTEPPDDPNEALSQAKESMRVPFPGIKRRIDEELQSYAKEIAEW